MFQTQILIKINIGFQFQTQTQIIRGIILSKAHGPLYESFHLTDTTVSYMNKNQKLSNINVCTAC